MWTTATLQWLPIIPTTTTTTSSASSSAHFPPRRYTPPPVSLSSSSAASYPDDDEEEQVIGDCVVYEEGVFEDDPFTFTSNHPSTLPSAVPTSLVPEDWSHVVEEINLSKPQRRKIAQDAQFGQRIFNSKNAKLLNSDEYQRFKEYKLSQLNPIRLDNPEPTAFPPTGQVSTSRVAPKSPKWAVYGRGLDDISDFFNSPSYDPNSNSNSQGRVRQKLFTKDEKLLLNSKTPNLAVASSLKWLPLHTLAASGQFYLVNSLLQFRVDINAVDVDGLTALHKAIICKKQAITNYLLRESANSSVRDKDGATLMHYAVQTASSLAIKTLVLHDVDINLQDNDGWTPLHLAVQARRTDVVRLLLIKGADKTVKNKDGLTPLELCLHFGRDRKTYELIKLLKLLPRQGR